MSASEDSQSVKVLKIALEELRRVHDHITNSYDQLRTKALTMIAGEVAIVAFLFSDQNAKLIMPHDLAGIIFFLTALSGLLSAFLLLIRSIAPGTWYVPGDMEEIEQINNGSDNRYETDEKFLLFLRKDYLESSYKCIQIINRRANWVNWGLYILLASVIILIALKYGGPTQ